MKLTLHTEVVLDVAHHLEGYQGNCAMLHGHSSKVERWFQGDSQYLNHVGILVDFNIVKKIKDKLDHKDLNTVLTENPTAENIVQWIHKYITDEIRNKKILVRVRYYETVVGKETWCEVGDW